MKQKILSAASNFFCRHPNINHGKYNRLLPNQEKDEYQDAYQHKSKTNWHISYQCIVRFRSIGLRRWSTLIGVLCVISCTKIRMLAHLSWKLDLTFSSNRMKENETTFSAEKVAVAIELLHRSVTMTPRDKEKKLIFRWKRTLYFVSINNPGNFWIPWCLLILAMAQC